MVTGISLTGRFPERYFPNKTIPQQDFSLTYIINDTNPVRLRLSISALNLICAVMAQTVSVDTQPVIANAARTHAHAHTHTHTRMQRQNCTSKGRRCTPTRHQSCMISNMTTCPGETNCREKVLSGKRLSTKTSCRENVQKP